LKSSEREVIEYLLTKVEMLEKKLDHVDSLVSKQGKGLNELWKSANFD